MVQQPSKVAKRAAIYVRTSSEHQGEKASPDEQEADCRRLAEQHGLSVVKVYRDIERYRVKTRLVEPSATRIDRPGLVAMLRDGAAAQFDVILAWKEDRLYRGLRPMLFVLEAIQEHRLEVMLACESFDAKMAPIKAWVAGMELESMKERMTMGVKARLRAGKANCGQDLYGYKRNDEVYEIVPEEATWVRQVFQWYVERVRIKEIRRRLIEADAPQKGSSVPRKIRWARSSIQAILKQASVYANGIKLHRRGDETFRIPVPIVLDQETYKRYLQMRKTNKTDRIRHLKREYLLLGLLYCDCGRRWQVRANAYTRKNRKGEKVPRKTLSPTYYCNQEHEEMIHPDCPRTVGGKMADNYVWSKVCEVLDNPDLLIGAARQHVDELRKQGADWQAETERLEKELENVLTERQWVITQARKGKLTESDMDTQLASLTTQEAELKRELQGVKVNVELQALENWEERVREYLADLRAGIESLNVPPQDDEEAHQQFEDRQRIVLTLVERVHIGKDRKLEVTFKLDVMAVLKQLENFSEIWKGGIYSRRRASRARHLRAACASPSPPVCRW